MKKILVVLLMVLGISFSVYFEFHSWMNDILVLADDDGGD